ncbi:MAG: alpha/beta hydrolase [Flavobacteriaceae bacterium]
MKKYIFLLLIFTTQLFSQTKYEFIDSDRLGQRELKIQLPRNYNENLEQFYPLIVTLDGDYLFEVVSGNVDYMSYWDDMPDAIVVGINQESSKEDDLYISEEDYFPIRGGAKFYEFLGAELVPYLIEKYRVGIFKIVVGHGDSANFINFFAFKKDPLFQAYISISPSFSPFMEENLFQLISSNKASIFYYLSTSEEDFKDNRKSILNLNTRIQDIKLETITYKFDDFKTDGHYSLVANSIPSALNHIFSIYKPISRNEYKNELLKIDYSPVKYLENKYRKIKDLFGIEKQILLNDFRAVNATIIKKKNMDYYKDLSKLAKDNYPGTLLSNLYIGRYYESTGNYKKAIKAYQEAFVYDEIDGITKEELLDRAEKLKFENDY